MSNKLTFELVQPSEFEDYYYKVLWCDDIFVCNIFFDKEFNEWFVQNWNDKRANNADFLIELYAIVNKLNATTKEDKLFGFL